LSKYRIFETREFQRRLEALDPPQRKFILRKLEDQIYPQLRQQPYWGSGIKKLRNWKPAVWRYRAGWFRLFYTVDEEEKIVYMLTLDHRKDAYK